MHTHKYMHKEREYESERDTECKDTTCILRFLVQPLSLLCASHSPQFSLRAVCTHAHIETSESQREIKLIRTFNTERVSTLCYIWFVYFVVMLLEWIHSQVLCKTKQQRHRLLFKLIYNSWLFDVLSLAMLMFFFPPYSFVLFFCCVESKAIFL